MIADSDKHAFEGVLVYQLDRFARNRYDSAINKAKLKKNGVWVISARENISRDYAKNFGILPDEIYGWDLPEELCKPSDYALTAIMRDFGFSKKEMLVVDDMRLGYTMAKKQNIPIAFAAWSRQNCPNILDEMKKICDFHFDTVKELETFLFD